MLRTVLAAAASIILLSACAEKRLPLADVTVIKASDGSSDGMDIYAARRKAGEPVPAMRGNQIVEVRSFLPRTNDFGNETTGQELVGARCDVSMGTHSASVMTPGGVHVPLYGKQSPEFSVRCVRNGFQPAVVVFRPYNKTVADRRAAAAASGASGGLLGALLATVVVEGINAASDDSNDVFQYADRPILLRPGRAGEQTAQTEPAPASESNRTAATRESPPVAAQPQVPTPQVTASTVSTSTAQENTVPRRTLDRDVSCSPWCGTSGGQAAQTPSKHVPVPPKVAEEPKKTGLERDLSCSPWCG